MSEDEMTVAAWAYAFGKCGEPTDSAVILMNDIISGIGGNRQKLADFATVSYVSGCLR